MNDINLNELYDRAYNQGGGSEQSSLGEAKERFSDLMDELALEALINPVGVMVMLERRGVLVVRKRSPMGITTKAMAEHENKISGDGAKENASEPDPSADVKKQRLDDAESPESETTEETSGEALTDVTTPVVGP